MKKLTEWLTKPLIEEDINIPVNIGDTILVGRFKNKKMKIKSIGKDDHGMPTINGRKAATFRIHKTVNIFDEDNIDESKKEFVIWGIPPKKNSEEILYTKAKSNSEAKKVVKILTKKHGVKKARIQVLDLEQDPSKFWKSDDLFEGVNDPGIFKAVFLAGGPGSGKTYVASGLFGIPVRLTTSAYGLKLVNQDTELENFLKKYFGTTDLDNMSDDLFRQITDPSYSAYSGTRTHAKALSKQRLKLYSQGRLGVIIDGTGHKYKSIKKERKKLIDLGYDTYMVFVNTSLEVAQMRNKLRDRVLPSETVEKYWNNVQKNMAYFQGLFGGANFMLVDNNDTLGEKAAQKKFNMLVKKGIGKFIKKPIKSRQAKKWIDKQKITTEMLNPPNYLDNSAPTPVNSPEDENLVNRGKRKKKTGQPKFGTFRKESIGLSAGGGVISGAPSVKKVNKVKKQLDKKRKDDEYRKVDEIEKLFIEAACKVGQNPEDTGCEPASGATKPKFKMPKFKMPKFKMPKIKFDPVDPEKLKKAVQKSRKKRARLDKKYKNKARKPNIVDGVDVIRDKEDLEHFLYEYAYKATEITDTDKYDEELGRAHQKMRLKLSKKDQKHLTKDTESWKTLGGYEAIQDAIENGEISEQDIRDRNERMSNLAHETVIKVKQPIERGITIPADDIDEFMERFVDGEMVEVPDESGHGASGFSANPEVARGWSRADRLEEKDKVSVIMRILPNKNGEVRGLYVDGEDETLHEEQELIRSSKSKAEVVSIETVRYPSGKLVKIITLQESDDLSEVVFKEEFNESLPTKLKNLQKIKKVKNEPDSAKGTYNSTDTFSKHHAGSMAAGDMGSISEPDTYDWDDSGSEPNQGGHQVKKDKKKKGYEPVEDIEEAKEEKEDIMSKKYLEGPLNPEPQKVVEHIDEYRKIREFVNRPKMKKALKTLIDKNLLPKMYAKNIRKLEVFLTHNPAIMTQLLRLLGENRERSIDECIAIAKKFGDSVVLGKNRDRNYNPNLKIVRELSGYGVELCYVVDQDTDWSEGMNSEGIGLVNSALFVKRDEKDFDKAKKKKAMSKDGVRIREALSKTNLKDAVESLITYHGGIKGHTLISDGNKLVEIENTSRVNPKVKIHDLKQPVVKTNHGIYHPEQGYANGADRHSSVVRLNNSLEILTKEKDYKKVFPAFYNHKQDEGPKYDLVRAQNKLWTSSQLMMNLNKKEVTLYLIPGAVKFLGIENTLPNDYESKIKLKVRQYEHSPGDKYDTYVTTDKAEKKSAIKDTGVTVEKLNKRLDLYTKNVVYSLSEKGDFTTNVIEEKSKIKKVVGVYGGRFQPFGPHHLKTYEWLKKQVDVAYITTSDIKQPPRHPMNFKEKVRHMVKMGVPKNRIIKERTPYVAKNTLKKFDEETTAVIYIFGEKDADRLKGGTKISGGKTYYQDYKKNKNKMSGYEEHGYIHTAPHVSVRVGGKEVSGTVMRELLGSPEFEKNREKLFKKAFGYFDKGVFQMMTNKFKKLYEVFDSFLIKNPNIIPKLLKEVANSGMFPTDDGPPTFYDGFEDYKRVTKTWIENMYSHEQINDTGWDLLSYIISDSAVDPGLDYTTSKNIVPAVAYGKKGAGAYGERFGKTNPIEAYKDRIKFIMSSLGWEVLNWNGITPDGKDYTGVAVEAPVSAGVDIETVGQNTKRAKKLKLSPMDKFHSDNIFDLKEYVNLLVTDKQDNGKELLLMGGAYGHMNHPFDDKNLTFGDLKNIITLGLGGNLSREDNVTEKLDGQNLMVSWKDGKLVTARNKGQLKNFGANSMDTTGVASKFAGRGDIRDAFVFAMKDLGKSIGRLTDKQKEKIFGNGKNWMNLEVMYPASSNVINYDKAEIVFHGALEYDESGAAIGELKGSGRMLAGMIKQVNQHVQKHYKIGKPQFLTVSKVQDFGKKKVKFINRLNKLQKEYALKDNDTLSKYHQSFWEEFIFNASKQHSAKISNKILINLTKRWAFFDKSYKIPTIKKDLKKFPKFLDWVLSFDKNDHQETVKQNMKPFEVLFFDVGAEILKNISGYLAVSGDTAVQKIRRDVIAAIKQVKRSKDIKKIGTLKHQLEKLEAIGGLSSIVPSEGIVFKYKGNTYKFTGAFAPVNQILGLLNF